MQGWERTDVLGILKSVMLLRKVIISPSNGWERTGVLKMLVLVLAAAADGGRLSYLQRLRENSCPWNDGTCSAVVRCGHLGYLQLCRDNGCPWNVATCSAPACSWRPSLFILQWWKSTGVVISCSSDRWQSRCPWLCRSARVSGTGTNSVLHRSPEGWAQ